MQFSFSKWLTLNSKYLMHLAQTRHYGDNSGLETEMTYFVSIVVLLLNNMCATLTKILNDCFTCNENILTFQKAIKNKSVDSIGSNLFLEDHHRVAGFPIYGIGHILPTVRNLILEIMV